MVCFGDPNVMSRAGFDGGFDPWFRPVVEYVAWFNNERLHEALEDRPPREVEELYAAKSRATIPIKSR